jgi:hypothetical protein
MTLSRGAAVALAAVALGVGLAGCEMDAQTERTTTSQTTITSDSTPPTSAQASAPSYTIVDYIRDNGIVETPVFRGDPGSPTIELSIPPGWEDAGDRKPELAYGAILFSDPAVAEDPPDRRRAGVQADRQCRLGQDPRVRTR